MSAAIAPNKQPMGPLEEGDQAIVDTLRDLPVGHFRDANQPTPHEIAVEETASTKGVFVKKEHPEGGESFIQASMSGSLDQRNGDISTRTSETSPTKQVHIISETHNNKVLNPDANSAVNMITDRAEAQRVKLETAEKIDIARAHIGETALNGTEHAA